MRTINPELDLALLKIFTERDNYYKYLSIVNTQSISDEAKVILEGYEEWYNQKKNKNIQLKTFVPFFFSSLHSNMDDNDTAYYKSLFSRVHETPVVDTEETIKELQKKVLWDTLSAIKKDGFDTFKMEDLLLKFNEQRLAEETNKDEDLYTHDLKTLIKEDKEDFLQWRLDGLNRITEGLDKESFCLVIAGYDSGKTAFVVSEATYMLKQLEPNKKVLYFNNEQSNKKIRKRLLAALINQKAIPEENFNKYLRNNIEKVQERYLELRGNHIELINTSGKTLRFIEQKCKQYNPGLIIIDQVDKIIPSKMKNNSPRPYDDIYGKIREIAQTYAPVIGVTQANGGGKYWDTIEKTEKYKEWISSSDAFWSNVDKQANTDIIIGIGCSNDIENVRNIKVDRCKHNGGTGKFTCVLKPHVSRFED
jgi:hypothetical protein